MHFLTDRTTHTTVGGQHASSDGEQAGSDDVTAFYAPVVDHWLEQKLVQTANCIYCAGSIGLSKASEMGALLPELRPTPIGMTESKPI